MIPTTPIEEPDDGFDDMTQTDVKELKRKVSDLEHLCADIENDYQEEIELLNDKLNKLIKHFKELDI